MKEILKEVLSKINMQETLKAVTDKGLEKLTASVFGALIFDFAYVMGIFCLLAIIDIISKCCSLSCELWNRCYGKEFTKKYGNLVAFLREIPHAYDWRIINSNAMKTGFISKMLTYTLLIGAAIAVDSVLPIKAMRTLVVSVLALTELISVCENLSLCNIEVAQTLKSLAHKRKEQIK
jgi:hypothetical protein